jgi:NAD(P)-dependent dehydrogenase (short-subunit alcohol dehydrogenase family)
MVPTRQSTTEGIELQFGTNYLGPFLLTNLLIPQLLAAASSARPGATRHINVTSDGHRISSIRFSGFNLNKPSSKLPDSEQPIKAPVFQPKDGETYSGFVAYAQSKTGNILFSMSINKILEIKGVRSYAVHPGCMCLPAPLPPLFSPVNLVLLE